jgi:uncharacterized protein (DUF1800 family)
MAAPVSALTTATTPPISYRPAGELDLATALAPYAGPWGTRQAAHLLRRAGFGGSPDDVSRTAAAGMQRAVDGLVRFPDTSGLVAPPQLVADSPRALRAQYLGTMQTQQKPSDEQIMQVRKAIGQAHLKNIIAMQRWFLDRMIATPAPLQEKMTLFWHGHFTSAYQKGIPAQALVDQNNLFRQYALGNIRDLTLKVSQDPAMLRYLDNAQNVKAHPNENYARELMELFTLGIGNYTETDVRESARAFTGWSLDADFAFIPRPRQHDDDSKTFLGRTGDFDGSNIVQIIFEQPAAARWFARCLLGFFVYSDPEPGLVDATAALLRRNDFTLAPVMSALLRSNVFYSDRAYRALVKSPVDFVVGSYQLYGIKQSDVAALGALRRMGQILFVPPNVKGWDGGASWLNSQTLLTRENFAAGLMKAMPDAAWFDAAMGKRDPATVARTLTQTILQGDVSPSSTERLVAYLGGSDVAALAQLSGENADERVRAAAYLTMAMPAYQLA